ncbi:MAG: hypothetical protein ABIH99_06100 [Candidatus Micrarchaeota archaeon]
MLPRHLRDDNSKRSASPEDELGPDLQHGFLPRKTAAVVAAIIFIIIISLGFLFILQLKEALNVSSPRFSKLEIPVSNLTESALSPSECLASYSIPSSSLIFLYHPSCPHCKEMEIFASALEREGYEFTHIDITERAQLDTAEICLSSVFQFGAGVPQFACANNEQMHLGTFASKEEMRAFADACKTSQTN